MIIAIEIHFLPEKGKRTQFRMVLDTEAGELKNVFFHLYARMCMMFMVLQVWRIEQVVNDTLFRLSAHLSVRCLRAWAYVCMWKFYE